MNPAINLNKNELKKRFQDSGMANDQVELAMKVFEDNNVPLTISFPFEEFISKGFMLSIVSNDPTKGNGKDRFYIEKFNFGFNDLGKEKFIPMKSVTIPKLDLNSNERDIIEIELEVLGDPINIKDSESHQNHI
ncbi:hypothetical protein KQY10_13560 [Leptospira interrogans]|uniref:Uncharacterized protein n=1 Tax=Leptospira interrogans serovar Hardjo str. Norma TaxID=1279460 RepID=A0A0M4N5S3_LEPIR|nr:hypothetical protein [Leptospira interrogans]ALE37777.1 hypothetical protein G436_0554 [Leptospira interrogans serovar Hardjo str. Norma]ALN99218.1 hypothetical protein LIH_02460 [Leptospira interrogans serovar Hardjo-prajitno]EKO95204.1 hypothetical protein LEP1GSC057_0552 [Leptospira interrogans str. Brem 329]MCD1166609.1 hypothetical protein [Leptospira interrogans]MCH1885169.1 hypothetical protein [Leptospira interrogans]